MLWEFEELGYDISINFNGRTGEKPPKWDYYDNAKRKELYTLIQKIYKIRNSYSIYNNFDYGNINLGPSNISTPRKMTFDDGSGHYVIVIGNLDPNNSHTVTPGYQTTGTWYKYNGDVATDGSTFEVINTSDTYELNASEVFVLTNFEIDECSHVVNTKNDGYGSLREAIDCATSGDTIVFDYLVWNDSINLTSPITIDKNIYLLTNGKNITIDGSSSSKIFNISNGSLLKMEGISIICGTDPTGRCFENSGSVILENVDFIDTNQGSGSSIQNQVDGSIEMFNSIEIRTN
jgi:hypothetical protein